MTLKEEYEIELIRLNENIELGTNHWARIFRGNSEDARVFLANQKRKRDNLIIQLSELDLLKKGGDR